MPEVPSGTPNAKDTGKRRCHPECFWDDGKSPRRVSRNLGLGNVVRASTVDHAQTDRRTVADSKGTNTFTASLFTRLGGRRRLAVRQFSLCGWEAASSQGRQAHWRGKLAASDRSFSAPPMNRDKVVEFGASIKLPFSRIDDFARRSQIRWHTRVACPCFPVLLANRIQPVRRAQ